MKLVVRILLVLLAVLAVLLVLAAVRALLLKAEPARAPRQPSRTPAELEQLGQDFARMIQVETLSRNSGEDLSQFQRLHAVMKELFPLCAQQLEQIDLGDALLYHWQGRDASKLPILLMGHQDVVPVNPQGWRVPPFGGEIHEGSIYGRGTSDDKCAIFCEMRAVENLLKQGFVPPCDVWLAYSINEETSGHGAPHAVQWFREHGIERFAMTWDEGGAIVENVMPGVDRPFAMVGIAEKGYVNVKITARGAGGHSSAPPRQTTVTRLAAFMTEFNRKQPLERKMIPEVRQMLENLAPCCGFGMRLVLGNLWLFQPLLMKVLPGAVPQAGALLGTTCAFTMMHGSEAPNVIPGEAYVIANLRTGFTQDAAASVAVLKKYAAKYDLDCEVPEAREATPISHTDSAVFRYLKQCIAERYPDCGVTPYLTTGGTDARSYADMTDACIRWYPFRLSGKELGAMHADNESIRLTSLSDGADFYQYFLEHYVPED